MADQLLVTFRDGATKVIDVIEHDAYAVRADVASIVQHVEREIERVTRHGEDEPERVVPLGGGEIPVTLDAGASTPDAEGAAPVRLWDILREGSEEYTVASLTDEEAAEKSKEPGVSVVLHHNLPGTHETEHP